MSSKSQRINYLRIGTCSFAWYFILENPVQFAAMWAVGDALSFLDHFIGEATMTPETDAMLEYVADIMWSTILCFSTVRVAAMNAMHSETPTVA